MRKVTFQYWVFPTKLPITNGRGIEKSVGHFSEPQEGYFHGWGTEVREDANSMAAESVALIEHAITQEMYGVAPAKIKFAEPPPKEVSIVTCAACEGLGKIKPFGSKCQICEGKGYNEHTFEYINGGDNGTAYKQFSKHKHVRHSHVNDAVGYMAAYLLRTENRIKEIERFGVSFDDDKQHYVHRYFSVSKVLIETAGEDEWQTALCEIRQVIAIAKESPLNRSEIIRDFEVAIGLLDALAPRTERIKSVIEALKDIRRRL